MPNTEPQGQHRYIFGSGARPLEGYTIKRAIGRGGFGEVYYATSDAGKEVALKLITKEWVRNPFSTLPALVLLRRFLPVNVVANVVKLKNRSRGPVTGPVV